LEGGTDLREERANLLDGVAVGGGNDLVAPDDVAVDDDIALRVDIDATAN
jgi:hypothetical protein